LACASARIDKLDVKERLGTKQIRPQIHVLLQSKPGTLKTTILEEIGYAYNETPYSFITYAGTIGSIDRTTGRVIPGVVWENRRKPLLLDEFRTGERGDAGAVDVLLGVLESGMYKRKIGIPCMPLEEKDGDLYYRVVDGEIGVRTRFPCIIATMRNLDLARSEKLRALIQRCIPIRYDLPDEDVDRTLQGFRLYHPEKIETSQNVVVSRTSYQKIINLAREIRSTQPRFREVYARAVGDLCRIFAVQGRHDMWLYRLVCYLKTGYYVDKAIELAEEKYHAAR
jgi:hypothetical protein